jgi:hypothetical protein
LLFAALLADHQIDLRSMSAAADGGRIDHGPAYAERTTFGTRAIGGSPRFTAGGT